MSGNPEDLLFSLSFASLNLDGTNRHSTIADKPKLTAKVEQWLKERTLPSIVTLSELSPTISYPTDYEATSSRFGNEKLVTLVNETVLEFASEPTNTWESSVARYQACLLVEKISKAKILHFSVHLPRKNRTLADNLFKKAIEELSESMRPDFVTIAGDFNMNPTDLKNSVCVGFETAFDDGVATTKADHSLDNILYHADEFVFSEPKNEPVVELTHHILGGKLKARPDYK